MSKTSTYVLLVAIVAGILAAIFIVNRTSGVDTVSERDRIVYTKRKEQSDLVIKSFTDKTDPSAKFIWYQALARAELGLQNYQASANAFNLALQADPKNPLVPATKVEYSAILVLLKDYQGAQSAIQEAVAIRPEIPDYWLAYIALKKDHLDASDAQIQDLYREAIKKSKNHAVLIGAYALYLEQKSDLKGALYQWRVLLKAYPGNQEAAENIPRLEKLVK